MATATADPDALKEAKEAAAQELDALELTDKHDPRVWDLDFMSEHRQYIQRPLAFMAKIELFSLFAETLDNVMSQGDKPLTLENTLEMLMGPETARDKLSPEDVNDAEAVMKIVLRLATSSPDFMARLFVIILHVPREDRPWFRLMLSDPEAGFTDDEAIDCIETFIDQNAEAVESFFAEKIKRVGTRAKSRFSGLAGAVAPPSKPSTRSRPRSAGRSRK